MDPLKLPTLWLCENAVFLPEENTLVISDLQLGLEQQLRQGATVLYEQANQMLQLLESLIKQTKAKRLVINGDLKHEFGKISFQERKDILMMLRKLKEQVEIIVVKGNHDTLTKPLTDELGIALVPFWSSDGFYAVHGHALPEETKEFKQAHTVIIGHMHPAITVSDGVRNERYKCFLLGMYKQKQLVVLPSFSTVVEGSSVLHQKPNSPLVHLDSCDVFVLADTIRSFGKVSALKHILG